MKYLVTCVIREEVVVEVEADSFEEANDNAVNAVRVGFGEICDTDVYAVSLNREDGEWLPIG